MPALVSAPLPHPGKGFWGVGGGLGGEGGVGWGDVRRWIAVG